MLLMLPGMTWTRTLDQRRWSHCMLLWSNGKSVLLHCLMCCFFYDLILFGFDNVLVHVLHVCIAYYVTRGCF